MQNKWQRFHLALPVIDIGDTREFYTKTLGCAVGRSASNWIDVDFWGNQITFQEAPEHVKTEERSYLNGDTPVAHFGAVLEQNDWEDLKQAINEEEILFLKNPRVVFEGEIGEQYSFFLEDPSGYAIEFKAFKEQGNIFKAE